MAGKTDSTEATVDHCRDGRRAKITSCCRIYPIEFVERLYQGTSFLRIEVDLGQIYDKLWWNLKFYSSQRDRRTTSWARCVPQRQRGD